MKGLLKTYSGEELVDKAIVELPDDYDGNPYGDTVPFPVHSNQTLEVLALTDEQKSIAEPMLETWGNLCLIQGTFKGEQVAFLCTAGQDEKTGEFRASPIMIVVTEDMYKDCEAFDGQKIGEYEKQMTVDGGEDAPDKDS